MSEKVIIIIDGYFDVTMFLKRGFERKNCRSELTDQKVEELNDQRVVLAHKLFISQNCDCKNSFNPEC